MRTVPAPAGRPQACRWPRNSHEEARPRPQLDDSTARSGGRPRAVRCQPPSLPPPHQCRATLIALNAKSPTESLACCAASCGPGRTGFVPGLQRVRALFVYGAQLSLSLSLTHPRVRETFDFWTSCLASSELCKAVTHAQAMTTKNMGPGKRARAAFIV